MKKLRDHRAKRASGHDDRAFRTERTARTNRNCGRKRLEQRDLGFHAAAVDQNRFDGFWNAVPADSFGAVARHNPNNECATDGDENAVPSQMISRGGNERRTPVAIIK